MILIEDTYKMRGTSEGDLSFTKAIVFVLENCQLVFEKDIWLSEGIFIYRGANAINKIAGVEEDKPDGSEGVTFESERHTVSLKS